MRSNMTEDRQPPFELELPDTRDVEEEIEDRCRPAILDHFPDAGRRHIGFMWCFARSQGA
jgi:hypothetical protein